MKIVWPYPCSVCYYFHMKIGLIKGVTCTGIYLYTLWPKSHPPLELYIGPGTSPDHVWASKEIGHQIIKTVVVYLWGSVRRCELKCRQLWCIIHRVTRVQSRDRKFFEDINVFERPTLIHLVIYIVLLMLILCVFMNELKLAMNRMACLDICAVFGIHIQCTLKYTTAVSHEEYTTQEV